MSEDLISMSTYLIKNKYKNSLHLAFFIKVHYMNCQFFYKYLPNNCFDLYPTIIHFLSNGTANAQSSSIPRL